MNQDTVQEDDYAIDVLTKLIFMVCLTVTIQPDTHNLIRFKEQAMRKSQYFETNNAAVDDPSFPLSFYNYLKSKDITAFINEHKYDRYDSSVERNQLKKLVPKSMLEVFINDSDDLKWTQHKFRGDDQLNDIIKVKESDAYNKFMIGQR